MSASLSLCESNRGGGECGVYSGLVSVLRVNQVGAEFCLFSWPLLRTLLGPAAQ